MHSNLTWLENHASRIGSDPPPTGQDVLAPFRDPHAAEAGQEAQDNKRGRATKRKRPSDAENFEDAAAKFLCTITCRTLGDYIKATADHFGRSG